MGSTVSLTNVYMPVHQALCHVLGPQINKFSNHVLGETKIILTVMVNGAEQMPWETRSWYSQLSLAVQGHPGESEGWVRFGYKMGGVEWMEASQLEVCFR